MAYRAIPEITTEGAKTHNSYSQLTCIGQLPCLFNLVRTSMGYKISQGVHLGVLYILRIFRTGVQNTPGKKGGCQISYDKGLVLVTRDFTQVASHPSLQAAWLFTASEPGRKVNTLGTIKLPAVLYKINDDYLTFAVQEGEKSCNCGIIFLEIIHAWGNHTLNRYSLGLSICKAPAVLSLPSHRSRQSVELDHLSPSREEVEKRYTPHKPQLSVALPAYCRRVKDTSTAADVAVGEW